MEKITLVSYLEYLRNEFGIEINIPKNKNLGVSPWIVSNGKFNSLCHLSFTTNGFIISTRGTYCNSMEAKKMADDLNNLVIICDNLNKLYNEL